MLTERLTFAVSWLVFGTVFRLTTVCLIVYWLVIFFSTHLPATALPQLRASDKLCHLVAFAGLSFLLAIALPVRERLWRHQWLVATIAVVYAGMDEYTQQYVPGRTSDWWDFAADTLGVGLGLLAYLITRWLFIKLSRPSAAAQVSSVAGR